MNTSPEVDQWFARYANPMKPVVERMRAIMLAADARLGECIKWQAPTFTYRGNLASFFPRSKQHASLMFHTGAAIPGHHPRLEGGGDTSRVVKLGSLAEVEAARAELERVVRAWCDWRDELDGGDAAAKGARAARAPGKVPRAAAKAPADVKPRRAAAKAPADVKPRRAAAKAPAAKAAAAKAPRTTAKAPRTTAKAPRPAAKAPAATPPRRASGRRTPRRDR